MESFGRRLIAQGVGAKKESTAAKSNFIWDVESDNVLIETDDFDVTQVVYTNEPNTFGSLVCQKQNSATNWFCFDALGSTWNLTNASETITDSYIYDAWGNQLTSTETTTNPFQYVGQFGYYYDMETNSNYVRARVYQPTIARWWSQEHLLEFCGISISDNTIREIAETHGRQMSAWQRIASLCSLVYSDLWNTYWTTPPHNTKKTLLHPRGRVLHSRHCRGLGHSLY